MPNTPQDSPAPEEVFARRFREVREAAGLTQATIAEQMTMRGYRMHQTAVAKIESGTRPVSLGEAVQLAQMLAVDLDTLTGADTSDVDLVLMLHHLMRLGDQRQAAEAEAERLGDLIDDLQSEYDKHRKERAP